MRVFAHRLITLFLSLVLIFVPFVPIAAADSIAAPQIQVTPNGVKENITLTFSQSISNGNIVDIEVENASNNKVWQYFTPNGGTNFSATTSDLPTGVYSVNVGLFTQNWGSNYAWFGQIATFGGITPTPALAQNAAYSTAMTAYTDWKAKYVVWQNGLARVVRPENNNDTVSEGIGYGMWLAVAAKDQSTFWGLWNYARKYLDGKGLMNWDIDSSGNIIGQGSATDADEDIAYSLLKADALWPGNGLGNSAKTMIVAIKQYEVVNGYMNPGDNWGATNSINPSYLAPSYYKAFATLTGDNSWNDIANKNSNWLSQAANTATGLLPDWLNSDFSQAAISFDQHKNDFYYDALRTPIRLLMDYKATGDGNALNILQKQANFFANIGADKLTAGYTLSGQPLSSYMDTAFLTSYTAASQINPSSAFAQTMLNKLLNIAPNGYFGTSLRAITLFVLAGNY